MSLLDTIKNLINKLDGNKPELEQKEEISTPEVKSKPVVETKPEIKAAPEVKPETVAEPQVAAPKEKINAATAITKLQIPEDSALRRHFLSALEAKVVASLSPRPTDSSLKRHYDAMVQAEIETLLG